MTRRSLLLSPTLLAAPMPTRFQLACMTLPYAAVSFERALTGIKGAGYEYVAWGVSHEKQPLLALDAKSTAHARRTRSEGLQPVMMFSTVNLEAANALDAHKRRIEQAHDAGIPFLLTFGKTAKGEYQKVIDSLQGMGPFARQAGLTVVLKQHGGNSATGRDCARILREVGHPSIQICYDAGNVLDYEKQDPIADIQTCVADIRAFAIKDHRNTPKDEDCGPGFGEIDHYKLLAPVMKTGLTMPLACENIFEPLTPRPTDPAVIDALARRAREYLDAVLRGLQTTL